MNKNHPFHMVQPSPWPLLVSLMLMNNFFMTISWLYTLNYYYLLTIPCTMLCAYQWWRDITRESTYQGLHTKSVYKMMRSGMILFIISEIFFFLSFFWSYFHSSLSPNIEIGQLWPPMGILPFNPFNVPLLNTIILISSGLTVTWSHHSMLTLDFKESKFSLMLTILLGLYFSMIQLYEYNESPFSISDSIYGSTFFMATGFHGIHVIIGTTFLYICLMRMNIMHFSNKRHFGFEAATWYWHFVDIVWLFLYLSIYWWSY